MRPDNLFPLFKTVNSLKGVGDRIAKLIEKLAGIHLIDLCWHLPVGLIDRRYAPKISEVTPGVIATMTVTVMDHRKPPNKRMPYKVICSDDTGLMSLIFFHAHTDYLIKTLPVGEVRVVSGRVEIFNDEVQMTHPDHIAPLAEIEMLQTVEPVYPLTAGLSAKVLSKSIKGSLAEAPELDEWIDPSFVAKNNWPDWKTALLEAHNPKEPEDIEAMSLNRSRLAYDELFANQLALSLVRQAMRRLPGRSIAGDGQLRDKIIKSLPFDLTASQKVSTEQVIEDMRADYRMLRLLQGDVGSGKTIVALLAMLNAIEAGAQAVLLAPTEILARQHMATIEPLAAQVGIETVLLTGRDKGKKREAILERLVSGQAKIAIGTHALFQDDVHYHDLALAVIDEQHRFGVHQRLQLAAKGKAVDVLVMTATPIPRTLMLTAYGDLDVSRLTEKPAGRKPIDTRVMPVERLDDIVQGVRRSLDTGAKVYWICPLIEESEVLDVAAADDRFDHLKQVFGNQVGLVHGRLKSSEKDAAMADFINGTTRILVATTVIEVGVDVPDATIMVIEHAERFGLAQLHQLRGRIGRGSDASTCLLLYGSPLTATAKSRLKVMRESEDGFLIAEQDLQLRGAGELLGTRQSGLPEFRIADLIEHSDLMSAARDDANLVLNRDPELKSERGQAIRTLLYLFEREAAIKNLRSG